LYRCCEGFYFDAVSGPRPDSLLLHGQKKRTKEKAARFLARQTTPGSLRFSSALAYNQTRTKGVLKHGCACLQGGLLCSAASCGVKVKSGGCSLLLSEINRP